MVDMERHGVFEIGESIYVFEPGAAKSKVAEQRLAESRGVFEPSKKRLAVVRLDRVPR